MKRTFTKSEAIEFLECNENTRPYRIIEGLEKCGFKNVEKESTGILLQNCNYYNQIKYAR